MLNWNDIIKFATHGNPKPERRLDTSDEDWKQQLSPEEYRITRQKGTEQPHSGALCSSYEAGKYACIFYLPICYDYVMQFFRFCVYSTLALDD